MTKGINVYTTQEVADILSVTQRTVYNYIASGQLKAAKIGRHWRVTEEQFQNFLDSGTDEHYSEYMNKLK